MGNFAQRDLSFRDFKIKVLSTEALTVTLLVSFNSNSAA
jgi:hypothetical protein